MSFHHAVSLRLAPARARLAPVFAVVIAALGLLGVLWQAFSAGFGSSGHLPTFTIITLNGLSLAGLYFITASGLTLIFGLMRITNLTHGALFLLGGYLALDLREHGLPWAAAALGATLATGVVGLLIHQLFLRWNQGQDLRQALITIAVSLVLADQMLAHFGGEAQALTPANDLRVDERIGCAAGVIVLAVFDDGAGSRRMGGHGACLYHWMLRRK